MFVSYILGEYIRVASFSRFVTGIKEAVLQIQLKSVYPAGGSTYLNIYSWFAGIELKVIDVDDVMEACVVESLALISVCENVCILV